MAASRKSTKPGCIKSNAPAVYTIWKMWNVKFNETLFSFLLVVLSKNNITRGGMKLNKEIPIKACVKTINKVTK